MYLDNERRPTLTPQLAFRVAVIGGVALVMFAMIFFRLWYLQVLSGDNYVRRRSTTACARSRSRRRAARSWTATGRRSSRTATRSRSRSRPTSCRRTRRARRGLPAAREAARPEPAPPREAGRARAEGAAVLEAHGQAGRARAARGLRARAPERVPRRRAGARVPARVPARRPSARTCSARSARSTRSS